MASPNPRKNICSPQLAACLTRVQSFKKKLRWGQTLYSLKGRWCLSLLFPSIVFHAGWMQSLINYASPSSSHLLLLRSFPFLPLPGKPNMSTYPFHCSLHDTDFIPPSLDPATGVVSKDVTIDPNNNVSARLFLPISSQQHKKKLPVLVYYHGGGFVGLSPFCSPFHHYLNSLVSRSNVLAVSIDYRLAPKYLLPTAYDDSWAALKWVASHTSGKGPDPWLSQYGDFDRIFIAGDSAGGNICHHLALRIGTEGLGFGIDKIEGMVLVHPFFWGSKRSDEEEKASYYDLLWRIVNSPEVGLNLDHPWLNPFVDGAPSLKGIRCERVLVCVAGEDELVLRGKLYYETLK